MQTGRTKLQFSSSLPYFYIPLLSTMPLEHCGFFFFINNSFLHTANRTFIIAWKRNNFVNNIRILHLRECREIQLFCQQLEKTQIWNTTKKELFLISILQILFYPWEIKNTIREISNTIRLSTDIFIVSAERIRRKTPG